MFQKKSGNQIILTKHKKAKLSMDDLLNILQPKVKKQSRKSADYQECVKQKNQRQTFYKHSRKFGSTGCSFINSRKNSINHTRKNSPKKILQKKNQIQKSHKQHEFKFFYQIGFGAFGRVWKVLDVSNDKQMAMKSMIKAKIIEKDNAESILAEKEILEKLSNPFIINMDCAFQDDQKLYLVLDYLRGADLRYHICYKQTFTQKEISKIQYYLEFIAACILIAIQYIHKQDIIHKDIKPENIVFQQNGYCRVTDFGIAKNANQAAWSRKNQSSGTPVYMAPEVLFKKKYCESVDFYALGVILYELTFGQRPYEGRSRNQIKQEILNKNITIAKEQIPPGRSEPIVDLINRLLMKYPNQRLGFHGIKQIKDHPFFEDVKWKKLERKQIKPPFAPQVVSQTKEYLDQITLFNSINQVNNQNTKPVVDKMAHQIFKQYFFRRKEETYVKNIKKFHNSKKNIQKKMLM